MTAQPAPSRPATTPPPPRWCRECGGPFYAWRNDMEFCSATHRAAYHKRRYKWGGLLYDMVIAWRVDRVFKGLSKMTQLADQIANEERARRKRHAEVKSQQERKP